MEHGAEPPCPVSCATITPMSASASRMWMTSGRSSSRADAIGREKHARPSRGALLIMIVEAGLTDADAFQIASGRRAWRQSPPPPPPPAWCNYVSTVKGTSSSR